MSVHLQGWAVWAWMVLGEHLGISERTPGSGRPGAGALKAPQEVGGEGSPNPESESVPGTGWAPESDRRADRSPHSPAQPCDLEEVTSPPGIQHLQRDLWSYRPTCLVL